MIPRLVLLTDRRQLPPGRTLLETVRECADAGLEAVIVREHDLAPPSREALVQALSQIEELTVISSRVPDPHADGLHLAADQPPARGLWGRSCHSGDDVTRAAQEGARWATLSPFSASPSKPGYGPALEAAAFVGHDLPVLALAGIDHRNAAAALRAGAHGVAVMGSVMRAETPAIEVALILHALR